MGRGGSGRQTRRFPFASFAAPLRGCLSAITSGRRAAGCARPGSVGHDITGGVHAARASTLDIRLPEGVVFSLPLAGPATRFLAWLVDLLGILAILILVNNLLGLLSLVSADAAGGVAIVLTFAVPIFYGILFEGFWRGQTPGKRALGLRVMDARGLRLDLRQVVIRNLLRAVDGLPALYLVGGTACFFTARAQRLGDLAADTVVVRAERPAAPDLGANRRRQVQHAAGSSRPGRAVAPARAARRGRAGATSPVAAQRARS